MGRPLPVERVSTNPVLTQYQLSTSSVLTQCTKKVGALPPGSAFGELALINDVTRAASIRADSLCVLWSLDRTTFRSVLASQERASTQEKITFLRKIQIFEHLTEASLGPNSVLIQY